MTRWHPATKLLLLLAVVAIPYLLWTMADGSPAVVQARRANAAADPGEADPPAETIERRTLPPLQTFAAVVERPLFTPSRRLVRPVEVAAPEPEPAAEPATDAPAEAPPEQPAATPRPELRFFGTIQQGRRVVALVTQQGQNGAKQLGLGDEVDGWRVTKVTRDRLILSHEGEDITYTIFGPPGGSRDTADQNDAGADQSGAGADQGGDTGDSNADSSNENDNNSDNGDSSSGNGDSP